MCNVYMFICMHMCVYTHTYSNALLFSYYYYEDINVCYTSCYGYEDELASCDINSGSCGSCNVVGITCGK